MKIALFSAKTYDRDHFELANQAFGYRLTTSMSVSTSRPPGWRIQYPVVCAFVNDD